MEETGTRSLTRMPLFSSSYSIIVERSGTKGITHIWILSQKNVENNVFLGKPVCAKMGIEAATRQKNVDSIYRGAI